MHEAGGFRIETPAYVTLSYFLRGAESIDIACGEGWIEQLSPETVGTDFSREALKNAKRNGAVYLVRAAAEYLPFKDSAFDVALCLGSLEHFIKPMLALLEIKRISKVQIVTAHAELPFPLPVFRKLLEKLLVKRGQPIEERFPWRKLKKMYEKVGLDIVFWGHQWYVGLYYLWKGRKSLTRLVKLFRVPDYIPIPSHHLVISYRKEEW